MDAGSIIQAAEARAGMADTDALMLHPNLERLVASINADAALSSGGEDSLKRSLIERTVDRLEGLKWVRDHPEISDETIEGPVFLCGLPRSGTTFFQYLFDRDPRFRLIRTWEGISPNPPPGADPASVERRKGEEETRRKALRPDVPGMAAMHLHDRDGPEECHAFMEQAYAALGLHNLFDVPDYFDFLLNGMDFRAAYGVHKRQLQLLQWQAPKRRWALKYPAHCMAMEAILAVHPDARFVITHRDPVQTLASICKLTWKLRASRSVAIDKKRVGRQMFALIRAHVDGIMRFASSADAGRAVHVDYYRLLDNPSAEMISVHSGLGIESPGHVRAAVAEWHLANPKGARGNNDYALEDYGLNAGEMAEAFSDYCQAFAIPREQDGLQEDTR